MGILAPGWINTKGKSLCCLCSSVLCPKVGFSVEVSPGTDGTRVRFFFVSGWWEDFGLVKGGSLSELILKYGREIIKFI